MKTGKVIHLKKSCEAATSTEKIKVGVSMCLLGEPVRYDGGHKRDHYVTDVLANHFDWVAVCPEYEVGMGVPREAVRLVGEPKAPRLKGNKSGQDWTDRMQAYAKRRLDQLAKESLCGYIFKSKSPSSGMERIKVYNEAGMPVGNAPGMFAGLFMRHFPLIPVEDEGRLHDFRLRENFIERVFSYYRLRQLASTFSRRAVVEFHTHQKLLIMAHSSKHYQELGRLVAQIADYAPSIFMEKYTEQYLAAITVKTTVKKHVNVMSHILGYLKKQLATEDKQDILRVIEDYRQEIVPLVVPLTLLQHYIRKYEVDYICSQYYLNPHPKELMLRNHV